MQVKQAGQALILQLQQLLTLDIVSDVVKEFWFVGLRCLWNVSLTLSSATANVCSWLLFSDVNYFWMLQIILRCVAILTGCLMSYSALWWLTKSSLQLWCQHLCVVGSATCQMASQSQTSPQMLPAWIWRLTVVIKRNGQKMYHLHSSDAIFILKNDMRAWPELVVSPTTTMHHRHLLDGWTNYCLSM